MLIIIASFCITMVAIYLYVNKRWKHLCILSAFPIVTYLLYVIYTAVNLYSQRLTKHYPQPFFGTDIKDWVDEFLVETVMVLMVMSPIFAICIAIFSISLIKARKKDIVSE